MNYVKRLAHRLCHWFAKRSALISELRDAEAVAWQATKDVLAARAERDAAIEERDLLRRLVEPWTIAPQTRDA